MTAHGSPEGVSEDLEQLARDIASALVPSAGEHRVIATRVLRLFSERIAAAERVYARTSVCAEINRLARERAQELKCERVPSAEGIRRALYDRRKGAAKNEPAATSRAKPAETQAAATAARDAASQSPAVDERFRHGEWLNRRRQATRS